MASIDRLLAERTEGTKSENVAAIIKEAVATLEELERLRNLFDDAYRQMLELERHQGLTHEVEELLEPVIQAVYEEAE